MKGIVFCDDAGNVHGKSPFNVIKPCLYVAQLARFDCFAVYPAADTAKNLAEVRAPYTKVQSLSYANKFATRGFSFRAWLKCIPKCTIF